METFSPIIWSGGKGLFVNNLLERLPAHKNYVEVFGGGASLLFAKPRSDFEVYNDVDPGLANFFSVLKSDFPEFYRKVWCSPYSRQNYLKYKIEWEEQRDRIDRAHQWFIVARSSFGGFFGKSWGWGIQINRASSLLKIIEKLPQMSDRMSSVTVENTDWRQIFEKYDSEDTFFYLDPPYVISTRKDFRYRHEMVDADHKDLIATIQKLKGKVMLSGYESEIYDKLPWVKETFGTYCYSAAKTKATGLQGEGGLDRVKRTEVLWRNFDMQLSLF